MYEISAVGDMVTQICERNKFVFCYYGEETGEIRFTRGDCVLTVFLTTMTIRTVINHPKQGKTQMFRKNCSFDELEKICKNPREHTGKGYKTKKDRIFKKKTNG